MFTHYHPPAIKTTENVKEIYNVLQRERKRNAVVPLCIPACL